MKPEAFIYWLAGYFEISNSEELTKSQVAVIKDHIDLVLNKVTCNRIDEEMDKLTPPPNSLHWTYLNSSPDKKLDSTLLC